MPCGPPRERAASGLSAPVRRSPRASRRRHRWWAGRCAQGGAAAAGPGGGHGDRPGARAVAAPAAHGRRRQTPRAPGRAFEAGQLDGAALVVAATDSDEVNRAVATSARERGIMVNVVDDPRHSSCVMPAIVDRSPVVVAIGTSGCAPVLARQVRAQIEALLPGRLGELARLAGQLRRRVRSRLAASQRRSFWERVLGGLFGTQVLAGRADMALSTFTAELETACATPAQARGEVYLIGAGPGDADLLTLRALQVLQCADVVFATAWPPEVLERGPAAMRSSSTWARSAEGAR
ncbi:MAG: hypothetical protein IPI06_05755 [Gammaproteobacteria bacterium]|nr:hypothetical protein [Gammaproteobacteria bacterium]